MSETERFGVDRGTPERLELIRKIARRNHEAKQLAKRDMEEEQDMLDDELDFSEEDEDSEYKELYDEKDENDDEYFSRGNTWKTDEKDVAYLAKIGMEYI